MLGMLCTGTQRRRSSFPAIRALGNNLCKSAGFHSWPKAIQSASSLIAA